MWLILDGQYDTGDIVDSLEQITAQVRQSLTHIYLSITAYNNGVSKKFLDCFRCSRFSSQHPPITEKVLCKMLKLGKGNPQGTSDIEILKPTGFKFCKTTMKKHNSFPLLRKEIESNFSRSTNLSWHGNGILMHALVSLLWSFDHCPKGWGEQTTDLPP